MNSDSWTSPTRSLFTLASPEEPQQSPPPPRPGRSSLRRPADRGDGSDTRVDLGTSGETPVSTTGPSHLSSTPYSSNRFGRTGRGVSFSDDCSQRFHQRSVSPRSSSPQTTTADRTSGGSVLSPFMSTNDQRERHRRTRQQGRGDAGLPFFSQPSEAPENDTAPAYRGRRLFPSAEDPLPHTRTHGAIDPAGNSVTFASKTDCSRTMKPPPLSVDAFAEGLGGVAPNAEVEELPVVDAPSTFAQSGKGVSQADDHKHSRPKKRRAHTTQPRMHTKDCPEPVATSSHEPPRHPLAAPAPHVVAAGDIAEADKILRRIGYSLVTEALRLQGPSQDWHSVPEHQLNQRPGDRTFFGNRSANYSMGYACKMEYTYLAAPAASPRSARGQAPSPNQSPPRHHQAGSSLGDIPLYRATVPVNCSLDTLAAVLGDPECTTHYIFNAQFHRTVALCDEGRGCLQHTGFATQPPTDVLALHYMRLMTVDREFAKSATSQLSTRLCEALLSYLGTCTDGTSSAVHPVNQGDQVTFVRPQGAPRRVLVCSSTSVEDPRVPLQWGFTRCRVHLSAVIAYEVPNAYRSGATASSDSRIVIQYLYAQDPRDQREGVPGPTGGDHSLAAMLAQRAQNLRGYCEAQEWQRGQGDKKRGSKASRFVVSAPGTEEGVSHGADYGASLLSPSSPYRGSPSAPLSHLSYYKTVWSRIRDMENERAAQQPSFQPHSTGAAAAKSGEAPKCPPASGFNVNYGKAVMASSSPEPRPPWVRPVESSPVPRPTVLVPPATTSTNGAAAPVVVDPIPIPRTAPVRQHTATIDIDECSEIPNITGYDDRSLQHPTANNTPRIVTDNVLSGVKPVGGPVPDALSIVRESAVVNGRLLSPSHPGSHGTTPVNTGTRSTSSSRPWASNSQRRSSEPFERELHIPDSFPHVTRRPVTRRNSPLGEPIAVTAPHRAVPPQQTETKRKPSGDVGGAKHKTQRARTVPAHPRPSTPALRAVRIDFIACEGLPTIPPKQSPADTGEVALQILVRSHPGDVRLHTTPVPYANHVDFLSLSAETAAHGRGGDVARTVSSVLIPVTGEANAVTDTVSFTAVAVRAEGGGDGPLLRMGEADVFLGNLRAGRAQTMNIPLIARAGTTSAKERATLRCDLTPIFCGVSSEHVLSTAEEEEVRRRYLAVMRERCPYELHKLEVYVGQARGMRLVDAIMAVDCLAAAPPQATRASPTETRSRPTTGKHTTRTNSPFDGAPFERRPVRRSSPLSTATQSHRNPSRSRSATGTSSAKAASSQVPPPPPPHLPLSHPPAAPGEAKEAARGKPARRGRRRGATHEPTKRTAGLVPPSTAEPQGDRKTKGRAVSAPVRSRKERHGARPNPTNFPTRATVSHITLKDLAVTDVYGLPVPPLLDHGASLFVEAHAVSHERGRRLPYIEPVTTVVRYGADNTGKAKHKLLAFPREKLDLDVSRCRVTGIEPAIELAVWLGTPTARVACIGTTCVSLRHPCSSSRCVGAPHEKTLPLVAESQSSLCGFAGTVRCKLTVVVPERHHHAPETTSPVPTEDVDSLRQRLASYLWSYQRDEVRKTDFVLDELRSLGSKAGMNHFARRRHLPQETRPVPCTIHLLRWLPTSSTETRSLRLNDDVLGTPLGTLDTVIPFLSVGPRHRTLTATSYPQGAGTAPLILAQRLTTHCLVTPTSDLCIALFAQRAVGTAEGEAQQWAACASDAAAHVEELGRTVLPLASFASPDGASRRVVAPLVHLAGRRGAVFQGALELEVSLRGKDPSPGTPNMGKVFDVAYPLRDALRRVLLRAAPEKLHLLYKLLGTVVRSKDPDRTFQRLALGLKAGHTDHGFSAAEEEAHEAPGDDSTKVMVQVVGLKDLRLQGGATIYVKGYRHKDVPFLRTDHITARDAALSRGGSAQVSQSWKGTVGVVPDVHDRFQEVITFKIGRQRPLGRNEVLSVVEMSLGAFGPSASSSQRVTWLPLYGKEKEHFPYLGLLGVQLSWPDALRPHKSAKAPKVPPSELTIHEGTYSDGETHLRTDTAAVRDVASVLRKCAPQELYRTHVVATQLSSGALSAPVHAQVRQHFLTAPSEHCFTVYVHMDALKLSAPGLLPPEFTSPKGMEQLFISLYLGDKRVACCRCRVDPQTTTRSNGKAVAKNASAASVKSNFASLEPGDAQDDSHGGACLRLDIPASFVVGAFVAGNPPSVAVVLEHGTAVRRKPGGRGRQPRTHSVPAFGGHVADARVRTRSLADFRREKLSHLVPKYHREYFLPSERDEVDGSETGGAVTTAAPSDVPRAFTESNRSSAGTTETRCTLAYGEPVPEQLVELCRAQLSLRGLVGAAFGSQAPRISTATATEPFRLPMLLSARVWRNRITVLEGDAFQSALSSLKEKWDDSDAMFVLGDIPFCVSVPSEDAGRAPPPWLSAPRTVLRPDVGMMDVAREAIAATGPSFLLSSLHYDVYETYAPRTAIRAQWRKVVEEHIRAVYPHPSRDDEADEWHANLNGIRGDGTTVRARHFGESASEVAEEVRERFEAAPRAAPAAAAGVDADGREAQRAQVRALKRSSPTGGGQNHSISFWTAGNGDDAVTTSFSNASSIAVDPRADQSTVPPANTKRALF